MPMRLKIRARRIEIVKDYRGNVMYRIHYLSNGKMEIRNYKDRILAIFPFHPFTPRLAGHPPAPAGKFVFG